MVVPVNGAYGYVSYFLRCLCTILAWISIIVKVIFLFENKRERDFNTTKSFKVLDNSFALIMIEDRKNEFNELVYTFIIRHFSDSVLEKFGKHNTVEKA